ncbi:succinate-semialdehyde dehydrogenase/glutarate-semialdehyde dehydrogenase [Pseudonocardia hierapolitana]|uniref:Succinate-semialdehyde dehydrogenase/glutarate-semialdehyde dehydrogenase n=1 Tax=Pseudonocardia hierapolitana TaxID=1128676 RepID=A0A561SK41_9PSEU|nr:NAD-dependent succinate-semialdehyde dehydrogenase [Pseudonocardia hierapolitana]TWF75204.1 succinate-semialdehyde dehydrogenase/glutarate-semialdehyde dehydrogenase [Pseudonocardia hierapolitana]
MTAPHSVVDPRPAGEREFEVLDPATGTVISTVPDADAAAGRHAADTAAAAFPGWAATAPRRRSEVLAGTHRLMVERTEELARLISRESGKAQADARAEVAYAAEFFRWFAEEAVRPDGRFGTAPDGRSRTLVAAQPVGVAALVTPWNFPAAMVTRKVAPALAAGCTAVLKPAAETPLTALAIADILREAGAPAGALTVVPTTRPGDVVQALLEHDAVRKLSFTGSTAVGRLLLRQAANRVVNCSMELGGNAPFIVCADADLDAAVEGAVVAKLRNAGQACTAANRFLVHEAVADEFIAALAEAFAARTVGPPSDPGTDIGPLIDARAVRRIRALVDDAVGRGASLAHAPAAVPETGSFLAPLVVRDVPRDADLATTEIFGPIAPVLTWRDLDDVIASANATEYGLAGYVFSRDTARAVAIGRSLDCGMVGVNRGIVSDPAAPFGGMKQSGLGREGAQDGIRAFQETQFLSVA